MKRIGANKEVTLTKSVANYWLTHQRNQRAPITRHIHALAKLFKRTGWRNDQRVCVDEQNRLINSLQRLSAIVYLKDFGWKIPVTVFREDEITSDLIESFNVQKGDSIDRLMLREYNWTDKRLTRITKGIFQFITNKENATTRDLFDISEHLKDEIDTVLSVKESKNRGDKTIHQEMMVAAVCAKLAGYSIDRYIQTATEYIQHNESGAVWKALREWEIYWRSLKQGDGKPVNTEPHDFTSRVALRFNLLCQFLSGKRISKLQSITPTEIIEEAAKCRALIKEKTEF